MAGRSLSSLLADAGVMPLNALPKDPDIAGIRLDSRAVAPGDLFFALRGAKDDGVRHASEAVARGAVAIVADRDAPSPDSSIPWVRIAEPRRALGLVARAWFHRPDEAMTLVGITGTKGKTTVSYLVESIARAAGRRTGRIGTVGHAYAGREVESSRTTPEATDLFALLAAMRDAGTEVVAMEVSSHALALHRVAGARFPVAAFLNLGGDHLDFHGSVDAYFEAKASLFERLGPGDTAVIPSDDERGAALLRRTRAKTLVFGHAPHADIRVEDERSGLGGSSVRLATPLGRLELATPLPGRFNVLNVAAAAACGVALGCPADAIARGIFDLQRVPGRLEPVIAGQPFAVLVDYAHTEESLIAVLQTVRALTPGRLTVVFGCGGDRDRAKRPRMGRAAAAAADRVVLTSDNPRSEDPHVILREIESGVPPEASSRVTVLADRAAAIAEAIRDAAAGDAVLLAGKGHETTQTFSDRVDPFDDRLVARDALAARGFDGGHRARA
jgi:UDP-N-acetylmuramoyl-L-alanyl-D-glutamate--2,6-diaminopimelate ligase